MRAVGWSALIIPAACVENAIRISDGLGRVRTVGGEELSCNVFGGS